MFRLNSIFKAINQPGREVLKISRERLVPLLRYLVELEKFLSSLRLDHTPYFVKFLERMKLNVETCIELEYMEWENIEASLRRDWEEANDTFLGIPGFAMPGLTEEERIERTFRFLRYVSTINTIVTGEKEQVML